MKIWRFITVLSLSVWRVFDMSKALVIKSSMIGDETDDETVCWLIRQAPIRYDKM